jgi:intracellular sulfur oxidation DsrE/DsrF family protein
MINSAGRILAVAVVLCLSQATAATLKKASNAPVHRLMIQVNQNDPALMNLALNNATNVLEYYRSRGEQTDVDIVAFGPGLHMLRSDTSPVSDRIKGLKDVAFPGTIRFSACGVTRRGMETKEGKPVAMVPEASMVSSGVVHMMELQEKGWSYVRP